MLTFNENFASSSASATQSPRFVFVLSFDTANTDLYYITSHTDSALPSGSPRNLSGALIAGSAVSQKLNPDLAAATIGSMSLTLADVVDSTGSYTFTQILATKPDLRGKRAQAYMGYAGLTWSEYVLVQTQIVSETSNIDGQWTIKCEDVQRQARTDIFDLANCRLTASLTDTDTTLSVTDTAGFSVVEHSESYSDAGAYSTGTATATNGSPTVTLSGAADIFTPLRPYKNARITLAGVDYSISAVNSASQLTLTTNYSGTTGGGKGYKIWPKVGYVRVEDEVIRYTGKTSTSFTGCDRGVLGTLAKTHTVDTTKATSSRLPVEEYVYLEMPIPKLIMALLTGTLYNQAGASLPTSWNAGVAAAYLNTSEFIGSSVYDLYLYTDDTKGISAFFKGLKKTDAKTFIERELCLLCGGFLPVRASGALGFKRTAAVPGYTPGALTLNRDNVTDYSEVTFDMKAVKSSYEIEWGYDDIVNAYLRKNVLVDSSITGNPNPFSLKFKGLASSKHTENQLRYLTDAYRDRYANPPMRFSLGLLPTMVGLEVGDVVATKLEGLKDPKGWTTPQYSLYVGAEIQSMTWDFIGAAISVEMMARSSETAPIKWEDYGSVLADAWYTSQGGTNITSLGGYSAGHLTTNVTMANAGPNMAVFYHAGDLTVDTGVTVTLQKNIQILVRGTLTVNGTLSGVGQGQAGATWPGSPTETQRLRGVAPTTNGGYGVTRAGAGICLLPNWDKSGLWVDNFKSIVFPTTGALFYSNPPVLSLNYNGTTLSGLPTDLSGQPGGTGSAAVQMATYNTTSLLAAPGAGGAGGAGLLLICRGTAFGANGKIDISGANGVAGSQYQYVYTGAGGYRDRSESVYVSAGAGAGGAPGAMYVIIDGTTAVTAALSDTNLIQNYGRSPTNAGTPTDESGGWKNGPLYGAPGGYIVGETAYHDPDTSNTHYYHYRVGADIASGTQTNARSSATRVQYLAKQLTAVEDGPVAAPVNATGLTLTSGTATLLKSADGTIIPRIKATWTSSTDQNIVRYNVYYRLVGEGALFKRRIAHQPEQGQTEAYIDTVVEGVQYTVSIKSVNKWGFESVALEGNHTCAGKSVAPSTVTGLTAVGGALNVTLTVSGAQMPTDVDLAGVTVYSSLSNNIASADIIQTTAAVPGKQWGAVIPTTSSAVRYHWVKTVDTTGNISSQYPVSSTAGVTATPYSAAEIANDNMATLSLIATGNCVVEGNQVYKNGGATAWDSSVYSKEGYAGGAFVSWVAGQTDKYLSVGLDTNPTQDSDRINLNYELQLVAGGTIRIYEKCWS